MEITIGVSELFVFMLGAVVGLLSLKIVSLKKDEAQLNDLLEQRDKKLLERNDIIYAKQSTIKELEDKLDKQKEHTENVKEYYKQLDSHEQGLSDDDIIKEYKDLNEVAQDVITDMLDGGNSR